MSVFESEKQSVSIEKNKNGIAVIRINTPGSDKNLIDLSAFLEIEKFLEEIESGLDMVESDDEITAVVIESGKASSFINGADISEYLDFMLADEGRTYSMKTQSITDKIDGSRAPFIASVNGPCLGVGLEIAIACDYRIASDTPDTYLGMNQIGYGLIPSAGGMYRLAGMIGLKDTLDLLLSGDSVNAEYAENIGLLDEVVPVELLADIAHKRALELAKKELKTRGFEIKGVLNKLVSDNPASRKMTLERARKQIKYHSEHNAGAAAMAIDALETGLSNLSRGLHAEAVYFGELCVTRYAKQMIRTGLAISSLREKVASIPDKPLSKLAVIGTGGPGPKVACLAAEHDIAVRIKGSDREDAASALGKCYGYLKKNPKESRAGISRPDNKFDRISASYDYSGFRNADAVLESVGEDPDQKMAVLREVESLAGGDHLYISNSFILPVSEIAAQSRMPENLIGMRFFEPVFENELVEIIRTVKTSESALVKARAFVRDIGRLPIVVSDGAGSFTPRVWMCYLNEALHLIAEGLSLESIEDAMTEFGFDRGPLAMIDDLGADLVESSLSTLHRYFGERIKPHPYLESMINNERPGRKSGRGFYKYGGGGTRDAYPDASVYKIFSLKEKDAEDLSEEYIQERLVLSIINEASLCLHEGVISNVEDADTALMFGMGFPDYRGGPFRYADSIGVAEVLKKLHNLSVKHGLRFSPPVILKNRAVAGNKFYEAG